MGYPHSYTRTFTINGTEFRHYHAQDAHGSVSDTHTINNRLVDRQEFMGELQKAVGDAEFYISQACGLIKTQTPDWSKR